MVVGYAVDADVEAWMELAERVRDAFPGLALDAYRETLRRAVADGRALCAKDGEALVGVLLLSDQHNGIGFLAVHPRNRGRGVASALVRRMLEVLPAGEDVHVTTYREGDPLGIAPRALFTRLGCEVGEPVSGYGYPCQRCVLLRGGDGAAGRLPLRADGPAS